MQDGHGVQEQDRQGVPDSLRAALATGAWRRVDGVRLAALATLGAVLDVTTTAAFVTAGLATEANALAAAGFEHGLAGGLAVFLATQGVVLVVAWLSLGPISTFVAAYAVVTIGVGGGLANAWLVATGDPLLGGLPLAVRYVLPAVAAVPVGALAVARRHDEPAWAEVAPVAAALVGGEVVVVLA